MAISVNDIIKVSAIFLDSIAGQQVNVFHLKLTTVGSGGGPGLGSDIVDWLASVYGPVKNVISNNVTGYSIEVENLTDNAIYGPFSWDPAWTGSVSTTPLPSGISMLIIARTGQSGVQGRRYLPKMAMTAFDGIHWASGAQSYGLSTAVLAWGSVGPGANGWEWYSGVYSAGSNIMYGVTQTAVEPVPAYQRRRKEGRGS